MERAEEKPSYFQHDVMYVPQVEIVVMCPDKATELTNSEIKCIRFVIEYSVSVNSKPDHSPPTRPPAPGIFRKSEFPTQLALRKCETPTPGAE